MGLENLFARGYKFCQALAQFHTNLFIALSLSLCLGTGLLSFEKKSTHNSKAISE